MLQSSSGNFPGIFVIFGVFFVLLNNFWIVFLKLFRIENESEKKHNLSYWAEPEGPTHLHFARNRPGLGPREAHLGPAFLAMASTTGVSMADTPAPLPGLALACAPRPGIRQPL
jgi:hypothetical protein